MKKIILITAVSILLAGGCSNSKHLIPDRLPEYIERMDDATLEVLEIAGCPLNAGTESAFAVSKQEMGDTEFYVYKSGKDEIELLTMFGMKESSVGLHMMECGEQIAIAWDSRENSGMFVVDKELGPDTEAIKHIALRIDSPIHLIGYSDDVLYAAYISNRRNGIYHRIDFKDAQLELSPVRRKEDSESIRHIQDLRGTLRRELRRDFRIDELHGHSIEKGKITYAVFSKGDGLFKIDCEEYRKSR